MTSNMASPALLEGVNAKGELIPEIREQVMRELRQAFRPEFLNRVDETVLFTPLSVDEIEQIVSIQIGLLAERLADRTIALKVSPEAHRLLAERGYDPVYGARPMKRTLQRLIETPMAQNISSVPRREGVPAQKIAMVSPSFSSSLGRKRRALRAAAASHGFPMKTQGAGASST